MRCSSLLEDELGERASLDILHRVEVAPVLASDREDWHDVRMVELGRCMRLDAEALQSDRVDRRGPREDFERNPAPERDLNCLVDDPHPSAADLTHEPILAENRIRRQCILSRYISGSRDG